MNPDKWEEEMAKLVLATVDQQQVRISVGGTPLVVEAASTPTSRTAGLGNREEMPHDGMLFMYPHNHNAAFHRTTMKFPIVIRFFDKDGKLVHTDATADVAECPVPYRYVLETAPDIALTGDLLIESLYPSAS